MKKLLKSISTILTLALTLSVFLSTSVYAESEVGEEPYVSRVTYEEITDLQELFELAISQNQTAFRSRSNAAVTDLSAKQILEERTYADYTETDYALTTFTMLDKDGNKVDPLANYYEDDSISSNAWAEYGITVTSTIYYTYRLDLSDLSKVRTYRCNEIQTAIARDISNSIYPTSGQSLLYFSLDDDPYHREIHNFSCTLNSSQQYRFSVSDRGFYDSTTPLVGINLQSVVYLSNGKDITCTASISDEDFM